MAIKNYSKDFLEDFTTEDDDKQIFNSQRLSPTEITQNNFVDISDGYANEGMVITFDPVHVDGSVSFKAFITAYTETFSSDFASEQVFGRIDPIHTFKQTTRNGTISFAIPSSTPSEAYESLHKVDKLRSMLYPSYVNTPNALTINQSPLIRIGVMNLLSSGVTNNSYSKLFGLDTPDLEMKGALTVVNSMNINFNLEGEAGVFEAGGTSNSQKKGVLPKLIEVAIDFSVIHERNMGRQNLSEYETVYGISQEDINDDIGQANLRRSRARATREDELAAAEANREVAAQAARDTRIAKFSRNLRTARFAYAVSRDRGRSIGESITRARSELSYSRDIAPSDQYSFDPDVIEDIDFGSDLNVENGE